MTKLSNVFFVALVSVAAAACGDDGGGGGGGDACTGHLCGSQVKITDPDGGNVIFEYIYLDTELQAAFMLPPGVTNIQRTMAYFVNAQDPMNNPLPTPGQCNNLVTTKGWPLSTGMSSTELDVGTLDVTGKNKAGMDKDISVPKQAAGKDMIQRSHTIFYQGVNPNADDFLQPNSNYTVKFGGAGKVPATTFDNAIFLANTFQVTNPDLEGNGPLVGGTDFTVNWTPATSSNLPAGAEVLGLTWLATTDGQPTHLCPTAHSAGSFTIKGDTINEYKQIATARGLPAQKALLLRQAVVHQLQRLPNGEESTNARRIDMLGIMCWVQLVDVQ